MLWMLLDYQFKVLKQESMLEQKLMNGCVVTLMHVKKLIDLKIHVDGITHIQDMDVGYQELMWEQNLCIKIIRNHFAQLSLTQREQCPLVRLNLGVSELIKRSTIKNLRTVRVRLWYPLIN